ncbi:MAG: 3'-5' exonuclease [Pirellulales bacterium]|nr:3'-5' exonuclease [Pirellulales bacterium]
MNVPFLPERFVVVDIETTGLDPDRHEIIEIGAIKVNRDSTFHQTFQALVRPTRRISTRITEITGITNEMLRQEGESLETALRAFAEFAESLGIVFFNADFDRAFLRAAALRARVRLRGHTACALAMARRAWPGLGSYKLTNLAKIMGLGTSGAHRALKDCELTAHVYFAAANALGRAQ